MVQLIVHYICNGEIKYYQEEAGEMKEVSALDFSEDEPFEWFFYNDVAIERFLSGYVYDEIEGIAAENIARIHENVYLKQGV